MEKNWHSLYVYLLYNEHKSTQKARKGSVRKSFWTKTFLKSWKQKIVFEKKSEESTQDLEALYTLTQDTLDTLVANLNYQATKPAGLMSNFRSIQRIKEWLDCNSPTPLTHV